MNKNRVIEYGRDWIYYNQRELNQVRSLKDIVSNDKRNFNNHPDEQRKGLLHAMILGKGLELHAR